jgi:hypothetical protein
MITTTGPAKPTPDQSAAHDFLAELRTRIAIQQLPYQAGIEASALQSLWLLFEQVRNAIKKYPGCEMFARDVTDMLNVHVRPLTAKWHRAHTEGRLASRDGADEFREDLADLREALKTYADKLHRLAYGQPFADEPSPLAIANQELEDCFRPMPFGIVPDRLVPEATAKEINKDERGDIDKRRTHVGLKADGQNGVGLGLSGGGIRSGTFCLGAVQVLAEKGLLKEVDFLSTVSGGGYTGSFLSSRLGSKESHRTVADPEGPDPDAIRYLRQNAKYLAASDLKQRWSMAITVLAGMILNWAGLLALIAIAAAVAKYSVSYQNSLPEWQDLAIGSAVATGAALLFYSWRLPASGRNPFSGRLLAGFAALTATLLLCWGISAGQKLVGSELENNWLGFALGGSVFAAAPAILRIVPILRTPVVQRVVLQVLLILAGIAVPVAALTGFYLLIDLKWEWLGLIIGVAGLAALTLNINLTGPHRLYRDSLARTFVEQGPRDTRPKPLKGLNPGGSAPYHLINTTVNLPSSTSPTLRDRKGDFFLFSRHWCGAPAIGYHATDKWRTNKRAPDLATAMAISGAAFSSHMGLASMPTLSALLTFFNVRLGFWIRHPGRSSPFGAPGLVCLLREMTGTGMSEDEAWLNLSDGGHIENMAVYELLRRRCKFIISIDGEADPQSSFHGHLTLVRHAQIDLGVRIDTTLEDLRPHSESKYSKTHYMFCRVHYPDGSIGLLLYVKLSTTGNEAEMIKRYRLIHPDFPHQTTLDQFFDEEQFEVYRQLGVHVMSGLFSKALMDKTIPLTIPEWFRGLAGSLLEPDRKPAGPEAKENPVAARA